MIFKKCPDCEFENAETAKFCNECGARLDAGKSPSAPFQEPAPETSPAPPEESPQVETPAQPTEPSVEAPPAEPTEIPGPTSSEPSEPPPNVPTPQSETPPEAAPPSSDTAPMLSASPETPAEPLLLTTASALAPIEPPPVAPEPPSSPPQASPEPVSTEAQGQPPAEGDIVEEPKPHHPFGERFKIIEELGTGSLGTVYKVFDKAMERELALKSIKPEIAENKEVFESFSREMKPERSIVHKNIARIFELNALLETPFITMEYVPGLNLRSLVKEKRRLSIMEAFAIAKQIFKGLSESHRQDALHLDLRPDNIMIDKEGTAKIMDLGIARFFRSKGITRVVAGMPQYMSPEQVEGQEADARSDIYAAGAIFYEMLTGSLPPVGQAPRNPKELNPSIPTELSLLVLKCLENDKESRYKTANAVWAELEQMETAISQIGVEPPSPPPTEVPPVPVPEKEAPPADDRAEPDVSLQPERVRRKPRPRVGFSIPRKIRVPGLIGIAAVILVVFLWRTVFKPSEGPLPTAPQSTRISLAVLPFEDSDPAKEKEYLGDALAETLTMTFKKVEGLLLPDKESSFSFRGLNRDGRIIGRRLQVDHYVDGNLRTEEDILRVEVKLVRTNTGAILWSGQYERKQGEFQSITDEIGRAVVQAIGATWPPEKIPSPGTARPIDFEAFDTYAQGRFLVNKGGLANLEEAVDCFDRAGAKEPVFGPSFQALADAYLRLADARYWPPEKAFPKAKEAALKAMLIDPRLAEAHVALARIKATYEWDFMGAERGYREALRLDPDCAPAHMSYAILLSALGRHREAIDEIQAAQTLNPQSSAVNAQAGLILFFGRLYDQANTEFKKAIATDPLYSGHRFYSALLQVQMEQYGEAISSLRQAAELGADPMEVELLLAHIYAQQDKRAEVGRILTAALREAKTRFVSQVSIAMAYAGLNERDQVIACLEIAYNERDPGLLFLKVHPMFDFIRADPRYIRLLQRTGLGN